jgi:cardiolipin synthase A/B
VSRTAIAALSAAGLFALVHREVFAIQARPSWPPPPDAVTSGGAQAATEAFAGTRSRDAALDFAWSTAATIEPWAEGVNFFPRIFADVEAAQTSVHILMFGWREGEVGMAMADLLQRRLADGVEVRVIVDNMGSKPRGAARDMYAALAAAGAQIVVNDFRDALGRVDHRKLYVIDGTVLWTGGAGIEDHFRDGGFHDLMARVTGDVVRQAQAAFLTSFRGHGGVLPADLSHLFPEPAPGSTPVALAQVIPGGFVAAAEAIREQIDGARQRLDVMNPYLTDRDMIERILAAARRGVRVRVVVFEKSNNGLATAALRHRYADLSAPGVEVWELAGTVVHAKVVVADDVVSFGTVNLDAWALYRNSELMLLARSAEVASSSGSGCSSPISRAATPPARRRVSRSCRAARRTGSRTTYRATSCTVAGASGRRSGCRMWARSSSPSISRGPGREKWAAASTATTRFAPIESSSAA